MTVEPHYEEASRCPRRTRLRRTPIVRRPGQSHRLSVPEPPAQRPQPPAEPPASSGRPGHQIRHLLGIVGPGLITGAADDDPSGIATYSQTGAQFGYGQLWTAFWLSPLLIAVQEACGRIGNVTGQGLARNIKNRYSLHILRSLVILLAAANIINIGADLGAIGAAAALVIHIPTSVLIVLFTAVIVSLEIAISYRKYAKFLKWLTLALLAYPITAFLVAEPWATILRATFVPHIEFSVAFFYVITGVIGTIISPYMFFWQTSQEVEENTGRKTRRSLRDMRADNAGGMLASQVTMWFIIVVTGTVLHGAGVTTINTAADAARALEPAGPVRPRHRLARHARRSGPGRVHLLRDERGARKERGPGPQAKGRPVLLRGHRRSDDDRPVPQPDRRQPHPLPGVLRRVQRHRRRPAHLDP